MKLLFKETFVRRLESYIEFIAEDSLSRAGKVKALILKSIRGIPQYPYKARKSIYFEDEQVRDLVIGGCTIVYRINEDTIEVFGFVRSQEKPND